MKLKFGKYIGYDTADPKIPLSYLCWMEQLPPESVGPTLREDLQQEIARRTGDRPGAGKVVKKGTLTK